MDRDLPERWAFPAHRPINFHPLICGMPHVWFASITCSLLTVGMVFHQKTLALSIAVSLFPLGMLITSRDPLGWQAIIANLRVKRVYWA